MREEYFLYCEEVEWCLRGLDRGMRLGFAPGALVLHYQGTTTGNPPDIRQRGKTPVYLNERNKILMVRDLFPARLPFVAVTAFLVIFARFARRGAWRQLGYALEGWVAGLRDERGRPSWVAP
jgi:GT2 family glycosyltransferase